MNTALDPLTFEIVNDIAFPVITGLAGWFGNQLWMSKKDRKDVEQKNYENATKLIEDHDSAYAEYTQALTDYTSAPVASFDNFLALATKGDRYFYRVQLVSAAILSDKVDASIRDTVLLPKIRPVVARTLPDHYATLKEIATGRGFTYSGELRRIDHDAIYTVIERYGAGADWERK